MIEVSVSHKPSLFTTSVTIDDSCYTSDDIKDAFLEIAENNSIEDVELIDENDIEIDYSDLPKWLSPGNLEDFIENYPNSHYVDMDIWEAAHDCGIEFSDVDDAYAGEFNSDEEFAQDLCEQLEQLFHCKVPLGFRNKFIKENSTYSTLLIESWIDLMNKQHRF